jgi:hypothetical protein
LVIAKVQGRFSVTSPDLIRKPLLWAPLLSSSLVVTLVRFSDFAVELERNLGNAVQSIKTSSERLRVQFRTIDACVAQTLKQNRYTTAVQIDSSGFQRITCPICPTLGVTGCEFDSRPEGYPNETTRCFEICWVFSDVAGFGKLWTRVHGR